MKFRSIILQSLSLIFLLGFVTLIPTHSQITSMQSSWATETPTIDGIFEENEWVDATHLSFNHTTPYPPHDPDFVHFYIKNTDNKLFLLFDDLPDNTMEAEDHLYVYFDANMDGSRDDELSMYLDRNKDPVFAFPGDDFAEWSFGFSSSPNKETDHTIIEIAISITFDEIYDGVSSATELGNILPVGTKNNEIRILFSAAIYVSGWTVPQDGNPDQLETYGTLIFETSPPSSIKPIYLALIIIGAVLLIAVIIAGIIVYVKRR
jgi:hypothetical protein